MNSTSFSTTPTSPVHTSGPAVAQGPEQEFTGVLELISSGSGFLRRLEEDLQPSQGDVFVPPSLIQQKAYIREC